MDKSEQKIMEEHRFGENNIIWQRYDNDVFCIWKKSREDNQRQFMHFLNQLNENINFTKEDKPDSALNFLDIKIMKKDGKLKFGIFRKTAPGSIYKHSY